MRCFPDKVLQASIDGELPAAGAAELERHLESCPACRERLTRLKSAGDLVKDSLARLGPDRIPSAPPLPTETFGAPARTFPTWRRVAASSVRVPVAALAMAGLFVFGIALGSILRGSPGGRGDGRTRHQAEPTRISLHGSDSVQVIPVGLDLKGYRPLEQPGIFTIKE